MRRTKKENLDAFKGYWIKPLTFRQIVALLDIYEDKVDEDSPARDGRTTRGLRLQGLIVTRHKKDGDVSHRLTKRGESRLAACSYEFSQNKTSWEKFLARAA